MSRSLVTMVLAASMMVTQLSSAREAPPRSLDSSPRLALVSAFDPELVTLLGHADIHKTYVINGRTFYLGRLAGVDVVMFLSGISMINASMTVQTAIDHFRVTGIVFSGIAGGVNPELNIGDVTVPAAWAQYQEHLFARWTGTDWDTGFHPNLFGNFGMMFPQLVEVTQKGGEPDVVSFRFWFPVDADMLATARTAASRAVLASCTAGGVCLSHSPRTVVGGNGVSGPTFVDNAEYRDWVWAIFHADALDMETAAVAHVAHVNQVPYIAFRSLSDLAGGGPGQNELFTFFQIAADNSARVVMAFLEAWGSTNRDHQNR